MVTTRRSVLLHGSAIGAGIFANNLSGASILAAQPAPPLRRSLQGLAWNDPIVAAYRDAVGIMKQKSAADKFNWVQLAGIHGTINNGYHYCPHGDWYFLPWHRAFTAMYERVVRSLTNNPEFAMPFWDWTNNPQMPEVFLTEKTPDGKTNWLYVNEDGMKRTWPSNRPMPANIVGPTVLGNILKASPYEIFGTSRNPAQNNIDPSWVPRGGGVQGLLEQTPHNLVHNNIGGWMPTAASPRDPIFFMHHCNIDRIWAVWNLHQKNSNDSLWAKMAFKNNFLNPDGSFWSPSVHELYVPEQLGYTYGLPVSVAAAAQNPRVLALQNKLSSFFASPNTAQEGVVTVSVENSQAATASDPLSLAVQLPEAALQTIARHPPVASGMETMDFASAQEAAATGTRAIAFLRNVRITDPQTTAFRVFLNGDNVNGDTPVTDPHYVGTFGVLDHSPSEMDGEGGNHNSHAAPSFVFDLTDTIQRVYGSGQAAGPLQLQLLPVLNEYARGTAGTATPERVEVVLVTG